MLSLSHDALVYFATLVHLMFNCILNNYFSYLVWTDIRVVYIFFLRLQIFDNHSTPNIEINNNKKGLILKYPIRGTQSIIPSLGHSIVF